MKNQILKSVVIAFMLALVSLSISAKQSDKHDKHDKGFTYKIGDTGPGGGYIFFVDYHDQYPGFTYLEVAPQDASPSIAWCSDTTNLIPAVTGWAANAVGRGRTNTDAMLNHPCNTGAAVSADQYYTTSTAPGDWFLPSAGELKLMYTNLRQAGVGDFVYFYYWSSTGYGNVSAYTLFFGYGHLLPLDKSINYRVRAVRAF